MTSIDSWTSRLFAGERAALGRIITWVENNTPQAPEVVSAIHERLGNARIVGFTGAPGAGKSTLVNAYIAELRKRGLTVGVVAVDPSSPFTGGAILGDRIRMADHVNDPDVFVRSVAARGHLGGLSLTTSRVIDVMDASGKDVVIVETVGTGQSELEIAQIADTKVVVCTPGFGDEIQAEKAGILEIADVFAVNKSDLPHADRTVTQLSRMLELGRQKEWRAPIVKTAAVTGDGVAELAKAIDDHAESGPSAKRSGPLARTRKLLAARAGALLEQWIEATSDGEVDEICHAVVAGKLDFDRAAGKIMGRGIDD